MTVAFVHLRLHSEYSLVDGLVRVKPLIKAVASAGMPPWRSPTRATCARW